MLQWAQDVSIAGVSALREAVARRNESLPIRDGVDGGEGCDVGGPAVQRREVGAPSD